MNVIPSLSTNFYYLLTIGFILLLASIISFQFFNRIKLSLVLLILAGFFLCSFSALLDPFLNIWDEQFHALVAKHLMSHPLIPVLFEKTYLPYDYTNWTINHIWLHKQPLFLWQIALSLKLFGFNEFAVRVPSIIMMSIAPLFVYRIGKLSSNYKIGFYGALLFSSSYYVHQLIGGFFTNDHNDIALLFYVTASIWAWIEYQQSGKIHWVLLIGLFSGCAVLVKWLIGLLVFAGWGLAIVLTKELRNKINCKHYLLGLITCLLIVAPWQIYIHYSFPLESSYELSLNAKHFSNVVEGHGGSALYYFNNLNELYGGGDWVPFAILISLFFFYKSITSSKYKVALFSIVILVYVLFSVAATKMISFCFVVSPIVFLSMSSMISALFIFLERYFKGSNTIKNIIYSLLFFIVSFATLDANEILNRHSIDDDRKQQAIRKQRIADAAFIKSLKTILPEEYVVFNCPDYKNIPIMFYTDNTAYNYPLSESNYILLKSKGIKLATLVNSNLPDFILNDTAVIKIKVPDKTWMQEKK